MHTTDRTDVARRPRHVLDHAEEQLDALLDAMSNDHRDDHDDNIAALARVDAKLAQYLKGTAIDDRSVEQVQRMRRKLDHLVRRMEMAR